MVLDLSLLCWTRFLPIFFSYLTQILCSELKRSTSRNVADQNKVEWVCVCKRGSQHEGGTGVVPSLPCGWSLI